MRRALACLPLCASLAGCWGAIDAIDPMVGAPRVDRCVNQDSDPAHSVSFEQQILPVFKRPAHEGPGCGCHQPTNPNPIGYEQTDLDLSSYMGVTAGGVHSMGKIVVPGAPCDSILWQKISAGPPFGARMPLSGPPFLDDTTRQLIADWIAEGAADD
jgi:hypothetical protein